MSYIIGFVYDPIPPTGLNPHNCRCVVWGCHPVPTHQCGRLPQEWIEGYGFCRQHAAKVRRLLDMKGEA